MLYYQLRQHGIYQPQSGWIKFALQVSVAIAAMAAVLWFGMGSEDGWLDTRFSARIFHLTWLVAVAMAVYFVTLRILGIRLKDFARRAAA
jgi:putative peptidoglycan lipid II flippase